MNREGVEAWETESGKDLVMGEVKSWIMDSGMANKGMCEQRERVKGLRGLCDGRR